MATAHRSPGANAARAGFDRSLLLIVGGAVALIVIGLVSTALLSRSTISPAPLTTPQGVVQSFYAAAYAGDYASAYKLLSPDTQRTISERELRERLSADLRQSQARVGAGAVQGDRATVPVTITHYTRDGLFGSDEWTYTQEVSLKRVGDSWQLLGGPF